MCVIDKSHLIIVLSDKRSIHLTNQITVLNCQSMLSTCLSANRSSVVDITVKHCCHEHMMQWQWRWADEERNNTSYHYIIKHQTCLPLRELTPRSVISKASKLLWINYDNEVASDHRDNSLGWRASTSSGNVMSLRRLTRRASAYIKLSREFVMQTSP